MDCKFTNIKRCTKKLLVRELAEWLTLDFFTLFFSFFFLGGGAGRRSVGVGGVTHVSSFVSC